MQSARSRNHARRLVLFAVLAGCCLAAVTVMPRAAADQTVTAGLAPEVGAVIGQLRGVLDGGGPPDPDAIAAAERKYLAEVARARWAASGDDGEVATAVEREIERRAEEARHEEAEWERRVDDAEELLEQAVDEYNQASEWDRAHPWGEPHLDKVTRTSAGVEQNQQELAKAKVRTEVCEANAARAPELAAGVTRETRPVPTDPAATRERQDLVDYARERLDRRVPGADVVADVQRLIERRAEAARKAAKRWVSTLPRNPEVQASTDAANQRAKLTEANATTPGLAEEIVRAAGGDPEDHGKDAADDEEAAPAPEEPTGTPEDTGADTGADEAGDKAQALLAQGAQEQGEPEPAADEIQHDGGMEVVQPLVVTPTTLAPEVTPPNQPDEERDATAGKAGAQMSRSAAPFSKPDDRCDGPVVPEDCREGIKLPGHQPTGTDQPGRLPCAIDPSGPGCTNGGGTRTTPVPDINLCQWFSTGCQRDPGPTDIDKCFVNPAACERGPGSGPTDIDKCLLDPGTCKPGVKPGPGILPLPGFGPGLGSEVDLGAALRGDFLKPGSGTGFGAPFGQPSLEQCGMAC
jgi:hypothetical protein